MRGIPLRHAHDPDIGDNQSVHARVRRPFEKVGQQDHFVVARHRVAGHVNLHAAVVREFHALHELFLIKIMRARPHTEKGSGEIHRVRAVHHRALQALAVPRRREKLHAVGEVIVIGHFLSFLYKVV